MIFHAFALEVATGQANTCRLYLPSAVREVAIQKQTKAIPTQYNGLF